MLGVGVRERLLFYLVRKSLSDKETFDRSRSAPRCTSSPTQSSTTTPAGVSLPRPGRPGDSHLLQLPAAAAPHGCTHLGFQREIHGWDLISVTFPLIIDIVHTHQREFSAKERISVTYSRKIRTLLFTLNVFPFSLFSVYMYKISQHIYNIPI